MVERLEEWVQFVAFTKVADYTAGLWFAFVSRNAGKLFSEAFGYGSLLGAGFGGPVSRSEGDGLVGWGTGVPVGQRGEQGPEALLSRLS